MPSIIVLAGLAFMFGKQSPMAPPTSEKKLSNVFADVDIRTILSDISQASGATILADSSVKSGEMSLVLKKDTVESALRKLEYSAGLVWKKKGDMYLVSTGLPDAPLFSEFATTRLYVPRTQSADALHTLLARSYQLYTQVDKEANLITITAPERMMNTVWTALTASDAPRKQFIVEALVTEISDQTDEETGFSWNWRYFAQGDDLGLSYAVARPADLIRMKALITQKKAVLRANPRVAASEGLEASLTIGNESYYSMLSGATNYPTVQYQRINTGITLKFTGYIDDSGSVNLHLQPEVSDAAAPVGGNPTTTVRRVDTRLRIKFGETVAIGGLVQSFDSKQSSKVPILGDLPILGTAFRSTRKTKRQSEVVILITPRRLAL